MTTTNELIRQLREKDGCSQAEMANRLGMARATYASLEDGREPKLSELKMISELFQISIDELSYGELYRDGGSLPQEVGPDEGEIEPREISPQVNPQKLRAVLLYLTNKVGAKANVGETVLYKLLYFIDFDFYEKYGRSITGLTYVKLVHGPVPQRATFSQVVEDMIDNNELEIVKTEYFSHDQKKYLPLITPDLSVLNGEEIEHINGEIDRLSNQTATQLSDFSHRDMPWLAAKLTKPLDYQHVFYRTAETAVAEQDDEL